MKHRGVHNIADAAMVMGGPVAREITSVLFLLTWILATGSGFIGLSQGLKILANGKGCTIVWTMVAAVSTGILSSIRTLGKLAILTWIGFASIFTAVFIVVVGVSVVDRPAAAPPTGPYDLGIVAVGSPGFVAGLVAALNLFSGFGSTSTFMPVIAEMKEPKRFPKALFISQGLLVACYMSFGMVVYMYCGQYIASPSLASAGGTLEKVAYAISVPGFMMTSTLWVHVAAKFLFVRILRNSEHLQKNTLIHWTTWLYVEVAPALAAEGYRVIVPYLRGNGPTTFLHTNTFRSGQQAALGYDIIEILDALKIPSAIFAGYDWGGRGACVAVALWPDRCDGLVSVNSYLIQDLSKAWIPLNSEIEAGFWYFYYFLTPRGEAALAEHPQDIARVVWDKNSPVWNYTEQEFERATETYVNPDYVDVVTQVYRHRLLCAPGDPDYADIEMELRKQPAIRVPAVTLDGLMDGNFPATDGSPSAGNFKRTRIHHQIEGAGHNLPQEKPQAFIDAVIEVAGLS
ncbi:uncharacterized protein DNG_08069 [Cephalotrichum gorgonifer]|uniref:AB hydrolase-1 domain-containing protein n=1 Tax=Cephalotrichum gorgonifer TaxID=2041049 RepID=A0AAE8N5S8_9PEZI|nr:uncharacterized protein DNG_08069 [Cephalotrichum gorgonifer]